MNKETVTVKKNKPPVIRLAVCIILLFILTRIWMINPVICLFASFLIYLLIMYGISYLIDSIRYALDKEKMVVVRKSSMTNLQAKECLINARRILDRYQFIGAAVLSLMFSIYLTLLNVKKSSLANPTYMYGFIFLAFTGFVIYGKIIDYGNKTVQKMNSGIIAKCDPILMFDIQEQKRVRIISSRDKATIYFEEMMASYFLEDYDTMYSRYVKCTGLKMTPIEEVFVIEFQGAACIKASNPEGFNKASAQLQMFETRNSKNRQSIILASATRNRWDIMIGLDQKNPDSVYDKAVDTVSEARFFEPIKMEYTYILAELQEMKGMTELAESNYKIVAENAGTMAVRSKAMEKIKNYDSF